MVKKKTTTVTAQEIPTEEPKTVELAKVEVEPLVASVTEEIPVPPTEEVTPKTTKPEEKGSPVEEVVTAVADKTLVKIKVTINTLSFEDGTFSRDDIITVDKSRLAQFDEGDYTIV